MASADGGGDTAAMTYQPQPQPGPVYGRPTGAPRRRRRSAAPLLALAAALAVAVGVGVVFWPQLAETAGVTEDPGVTACKRMADASRTGAAKPTPAQNAETVRQLKESRHQRLHNLGGQVEGLLASSGKKTGDLADLGVAIGVVAESVAACAEHGVVIQVKTTGN